MTVCRATHSRDRFLFPDVCWPSKHPERGNLQRSWLPVVSPSAAAVSVIECHRSPLTTTGSGLYRRVRLISRFLAQTCRSGIAGLEHRRRAVGAVGRRAGLASWPTCAPSRVSRSTTSASTRPSRGSTRSAGTPCSTNFRPGCARSWCIPTPRSTSTRVAPGNRLSLENMDFRKDRGRVAAELEPFFAALPDASFCLDVAHAHSIDSSMNAATELLDRVGSRLHQVHLSSLDDDGHHLPLREADEPLFAPVLDRCRDVPWILEAPPPRRWSER